MTKLLSFLKFGSAYFEGLFRGFLYMLTLIIVKVIFTGTIEIFLYIIISIRGLRFTLKPILNLKK